LIHGIKSFTAYTIGKPIWQHENFDRTIRDKEELFEKMNYIINNPVKAGIAESHDKCKWLFCMGGPNDKSSDGRSIIPD